MVAAIEQGLRAIPKPERGSIAVSSARHEQTALTAYRQNVESIFKPLKAFSLRRSALSIGPTHKLVTNELRTELLQIADYPAITRPAMLESIAAVTRDLIGDASTLSALPQVERKIHRRLHRKAIRDTIRDHDPDSALIRPLRLWREDIQRMWQVVRGKKSIRDLTNDDPEGNAFYAKDGTSHFRFFDRIFANFGYGVLPVLRVFSIMMAIFKRAPGLTGPFSSPLFMWPQSFMFRFIARTLNPDRFARALQLGIVLEAYNRLPESEKQHYNIFRSETNLPKTVGGHSINFVDLFHGKIKVDVPILESLKTRGLALLTGIIWGAVRGAPVIDAIQENGNPYALVYSQDRTRPHLVAWRTIRRAGFTRLMHQVSSFEPRK